MKKLLTLGALIALLNANSFASSKIRCQDSAFSLLGDEANLVYITLENLSDTLRLHSFSETQKIWDAIYSSENIVELFLLKEQQRNHLLLFSKYHCRLIAEFSSSQ